MNFSRTLSFVLLLSVTFINGHCVEKSEKISITTKPFPKLNLVVPNNPHLIKKYNFCHKITKKLFDIYCEYNKIEKDQLNKCIEAAKKYKTKNFEYSNKQNQEYEKKAKEYEKIINDFKLKLAFFCNFHSCFNLSKDLSFDSLILNLIDYYNCLNNNNNDEIVRNSEKLLKEWSEFKKLNRRIKPFIV